MGCGASADKPPSTLAISPATVAASSASVKAGSRGVSTSASRKGDPAAAAEGGGGGGPAAVVVLEAAAPATVEEASGDTEAAPAVVGAAAPAAAVGAVSTAVAVKAGDDESGVGVGAGGSGGDAVAADAAGVRDDGANGADGSQQQQPPPPPQPRMVDCAVSLQFLIDFCKTVPEDMPTWKVVTDVVVPATRDRRCRYVETLPPGRVGRTDYFISHRWATPFSHLVRYVSKHLIELGDVREADQSQGEGQGEAAGELEKAAGGGADGDDAGPPPRSADQEVYITLDVAEAEATVDSDRVRILADIAASTGLQELNLVIKQALVESTQVRAEAENAQKVLLPRARDWKDFQRVMEAMNKHTQMLTSVGRYQESARYGYMIQAAKKRV
ncbi:hypothetical protein GPECTOR_31g368 [Gonium pectorale]|uniref:Uncharacterized protein n=1 Tax=Gonium pectorale TaxID=33097 RepID=A0A150GDT9_GONPE|nr:hypothetical protein GPECTOR_31g368 [Gonium pectorale]|eukprot:KXZ48004.1 hypothetical protein GPECTOR_31g368 [Gonium pectorale]